MKQKPQTQNKTDRTLLRQLDQHTQYHTYTTTIHIHERSIQSTSRQDIHEKLHDTKIKNI